MNYVLSSAPIISPVAVDLKNSGKEVTVVTYSEDVKKYCIATNTEFIFYKTKKPSFGLTVWPITLIRRVINALRDLVALKKDLDTLIKKINFGEEDSFHLVTLWISYGDFYLAKELAKKGKGTVYYSGIRWQEPRIYKPRFNL